MDLSAGGSARGRVLALITSLCAFGGLVVAAAGLAADIPAGNLTSNPSFESNTTGWDPWHSTAAAVTAADAPNGTKVAEVTRSASNTSYTLEQYYGVNSANSARGGQTYTATAWVKGTSSTAGKTVKLRLREWNGTSLAGSAEASATLNTTGYQQLTFTYTAKTTGQAMTLDVLRENVTAAESFYVDAISLTVAQPALIPAANVTTNPSFETNVTDWDFWHGTGSRVVLADAPHGVAAAQVTRAGTNSSYDIERYYDPNTANSAQANHTYAINAWVRGTSTTNNKTAKLRIREWNANGSLAGSAEQSVTLESAKFKLVQLSYVAHTTGNALTIDIRRESVTAAESFYADAITMTVADPLPAPNVWDNPSVETDLSEWGGWQATIARVTQPTIPDPPDGIAAVEVTRQSGYSEYALNSWTGNYTAGNYTYHATAWVKGTASSDGQSVRLRLREWDASAQLVDSASEPVTLDADQWTKVELDYTAQATGHDFGLDLLREDVTGSESFYADAITITKTGPATIPADNLIANPSFETNTTGWDDWNGDPLTRVASPTITDAPHGNYVVKVSQSASSPSPDKHSLDYWTADELLGDYTYAVSAWVRGTASTDGKTVALRLREYGVGSQVLGSETEPVTLEDDRFKRVELTYQALGGGTALGLDLLREGVTGSESFYVDAFTMTGWTPPIVNAPSGSLYDDRTAIHGDENYELNVSATDGSSHSASTGVEQIDVYVDGEDLPRKTFTQTCTGVQGSCPMPKAGEPSLIWEIPPGEFELGDHVVEIIATDSLGHESEPLILNLTAVTADTDEPVITVQETTTGIDISAADPSTVASGVTHLEVWADGTQLYAADRDCPTGCQTPMTASVPASGANSPTVADIDVYGDDQAGNGGYKHVGQRTQTFQNVGFNELWGDWGNIDGNGDFHATNLQAYLRLATETGADTLHFPVSMCQFQSGVQYYQHRFNEISRVNTDADSGNNVRVIVEVLGTPWVAETPEVPAHCAEDPQGGTDSQWTGYVRDVLDQWGPATKTDGGTPTDPSDDIDYNVKAVELWNEPNNPVFWGGGTLQEFVPDPHRFAHLVNLGSAEIDDYNTDHSLNSSAQVKAVAGGLLPLVRLPKRRGFGSNSPARGALQNKYLTAAFDPHQGSGEKIEKDAVDAISVHLYANVSREMTGQFGVRHTIYDLEYGGLKDALAGTGFGNLDHWITEVGFPTERTHTNPVDDESPDPTAEDSPIQTRGDETTQASRLREMYKHFAAINQVKSFIVHRLVNGGGNERGGFGVIFENCTTRPAYGVLTNQIVHDDPPAHADPTCAGIAGEGQ